MWDTLQNKWGNNFIFNTKCIEFLFYANAALNLISFLVRLECCGVNSYDDWRGLSEQDQATDCFLPLSCDKYRCETWTYLYNNLYLLREAEINFLFSLNVTDDVTNSSKSLFQCPEPTTEIFQTVNSLQFIFNTFWCSSTMANPFSKSIWMGFCSFFTLQ